MWSWRLTLDYYSNGGCEEIDQRQTNQSKHFIAKSSEVHCCINKSFKRIMRQFAKSPHWMEVIMLEIWQISALFCQPQIPQLDSGGLSRSEWIQEVRRQLTAFFPFSFWKSFRDFQFRHTPNILTIFLFFAFTKFRIWKILFFFWSNCEN